MPALVFVDTNILLDFYRARGDVSLEILKRLDGNHHRIICTHQIEMEYKKNRQNVIKDMSGAIKPPETLQIPAFLADSQPAKSIVKTRKTLKKQAEKLKERTTRLLVNPAQTDPVYKVLQRLFRARGPYHLHRGNKQRKRIRRLALKRFYLGYPPRKASDTAIGDAVNWEWIVDCGTRSADEIVIVSRDSDFGITRGKDTVINDWLRQEFKERVSRKRQLSLTGRLTDGFRKAGIEVSAEEEEGENRLVAGLTANLRVGDSWEAALHRDCRKCQTSFRVIENEEFCPDCMPDAG